MLTDCLFPRSPRAPGDSDTEAQPLLRSGQVDTPAPVPATWPTMKRVLRVVFTRQSTATRALAWLFCGSLVRELIVYQSGSLSSQFYQILLNKDQAGFWNLMAWAVGITAASATAKTSVTWLHDLLALQVRDTLVRHLHGVYFSHLPALVARPPSAARDDNLDQRIAQDTDRLASKLADVVENLLLAPFLVASYTWSLASLSGWTSPAIIYAYFVVGAGVSSRLVHYVAGAVAAADRAEAEFRGYHAHVAARRESLAFLGPAAHRGEQRRATAIWTALARQVRGVMRRHWVMSSVTEFFSYLGAILNYLVVAIALFSGRYDGLSQAELGAVISQNAFVAIYLVFKLTSVISLLNTVSDMAGHAARVAAVLDLGDVPVADTRATVVSADSPDLAVDRATVTTPDGTVLFSDLSLRFPATAWTLVRGPSGTGKTGILRCLAGLWSVARGTVRLPGTLRVFYLPQHPYFVPGTLHDQLRVGADTAPVDPVFAAQVLGYLGLAHLIKPGSESDQRPLAYYTGTLSPGEQQRLAIARVLVQLPGFALPAPGEVPPKLVGLPTAWVVLDEADGAIDQAGRERVWRALRAARVAVVAVSHRTASSAEEGGWFDRVEVVG
ncbi:hypothetical protein H9P43_003965 [Blastocladiella emersonii ATCC 22665]|nr:hypothetical protein H9P43_003965 [Blastocladiella emersonii ATCC 22665]